MTLFSQVEHENKVRITCSVKDNGPGMTDSVLDTLFQKFSQASAKTHVQYGGSGLGLYISKRLVELLGGQISAKSSPGGGSDLRFYVICERPASVEGYTHAVHAPQKQEKVVDKIISLKKATGSRTATGIYSDHERPTLLVVEDNLVNQKLMVKLLSGKYNIRTANNGLECLALFKSSSGTSIDLVLCDIEMRKRALNILYGSANTIQRSWMDMKPFVASRSGKVLKVCGPCHSWQSVPILARNKFKRCWTPVWIGRFISPLVVKKFSK